MNICGIRRCSLLTTLLSLTSVATLAAVCVLGLSGCGTSGSTYSPIVKTGGAQPAFTIAVNPTSFTVTPGNTANYTVAVTETGGFNSPITLSASGLPTGATATFGELTATVGGATAALAIATSNTVQESAIVAGQFKLAKPGVSSQPVTRAGGSRSVTPLGSSTITVTAVGGGITQTATVSLVVTAGPDFTIALTPATVSVPQQSTANYTVTLTSIGGFNISSVTLSAPSGLPANTNATYGTPTTTATGETVPLSIRTSIDSQTPTGNSTFTVSGTGSGTIHTATAVLVVTQKPDFTITLTPATVTAPSRTTANYTVTLTSIGGFDVSTVTLSAPAGLPRSTNATFGTATITATGETVPLSIQISNDGQTPAGNSTLTVSGAGSGITHVASAALDVTDFTITVTPASISTATGNTIQYQVTLTSLNGFSLPVTLSVGGVPAAGTTSTFASQTLTPTAAGVSTTLTITSSAETTPFGTNIISVTGASGRDVHVTFADLIFYAG